jgi:hypothetical protein
MRSTFNSGHLSFDGTWNVRGCSVQRASSQSPMPSTHRGSSLQIGEKWKALCLNSSVSDANDAAGGEQASMTLAR